MVVGISTVNIKLYYSTQPDDYDNAYEQWIEGLVAFR